MIFPSQSKWFADKWPNIVHISKNVFSHRIYSYMNESYFRKYEFDMYITFPFLLLTKWLLMQSYIWDEPTQMMNNTSMFILIQFYKWSENWYYIRYGRWKILCDFIDSCINELLTWNKTLKLNGTNQTNQPIWIDLLRNY